MALTRNMKGKVNKNLSKIKGYTCGEHGHYVSKCLCQKKGCIEKKKEITIVSTSSTELVEFS